MNPIDRGFFARNGFLNLGTVLESEEVRYFHDLFEEDRRRFPYFWHPYGYHQEANYDALITTPQFDDLIRHPGIMPAIEELMGGPVCFGEIGLRRMGPYEGDMHQGWHRDRPPLANDSGIPAVFWRDHPDPETRAFYGVLNDRTRLYMAAFGPREG